MYICMYVVVAHEYRHEKGQCSGKKMRVMPRHALPAFFAVVAVAHAEAADASEGTASFAAAGCERW